MKCNLEAGYDEEKGPVQRCERVVQRWRHCLGAAEPELVEEKKECFTRTASDAMRDLEHDFGRFSIFPFGREEARSELDDADLIPMHARHVFDGVHRIFSNEDNSARASASPPTTGLSDRVHPLEDRGTAENRSRQSVELRQLRSTGGDWPLLSSLLSELLTPTWEPDGYRRERKHGVRDSPTRDD